MRRILLLIAAQALFLPCLALASDVLILQSRRAPAYEEVLKGFRSSLSHNQRVVVLSDYAEVDVVRIVREERPRLVVAIGDAAQTATRNISSVPILAVMSLAIDAAGSQRSNQTGISMFVPPEQYVKLFGSLKLRTVAVLYNEARSGAYLRQARSAARAAGIELLAREVGSPRDVSRELQALNGKVDALWMIPDTIAVTRETSEAYLRFGQDNRVPVIAFSASYLSLGAAMAFDINSSALGSQAAALATDILSGRISPIAPPQVVNVKSNEAVLRSLHIGR